MLMGFFLFLHLSFHVDILDSRLFKLVFEKLPPQLSGKVRMKRHQDPRFAPYPRKTEKK
jgi:hypothetical protein